MSTWLEGYEQLDEQRKINVQRWIHLNKFIAKTLRIDERVWFEEYLADAMQNPLDYSFMADTIPGLREAGGLDVEGQGEEFLKAIDPAAGGPKVALRSENNLGRLSPELQDQIASMLENGEPESTSLSPADVSKLQKIFPSQKALARLKRPDFRKVKLSRDFAEEDMVLSVEGGAELLRLNIVEFSAVMNRKLV